MKSCSRRLLAVLMFFVAMVAGAVGQDEFDCAYINEICWKNTRVDDGTGRLNSDWVELYNPRSFQVEVGGYAIGQKGTWDESVTDGKLFELPEYTMAPHSFLLVFFNDDYSSEELGAFPDQGCIRSKAFKLGTNKEKTKQDSVRLFVPTGHTRVSNFKDIPILPDDNSYGWVYDGSFEPSGAQNTACATFSTPTPGKSNRDMGTPAVMLPTLTINEVCYSNSTVDDGTGKIESDWVELYNPGPDEICLDGMKLGKKSTLEKCGASVVALPNYTMAPDEFLVIFFDKNLSSSTTWKTRTVNGVEKSVPMIRSNVFSLGTDTSIEVPGYEGQSVVVQDSLRLFAADGLRLANFKGEDLAETVGVKNVGGVLSGLLEEGQTYGYLWDGNRLPSGMDPPEDEKGKFVLARATAWGPNANGYEVAAPGVALSVPGRYAAAQQLQFTGVTGKTVRYTTDGSDPRVSSTALTCSIGDIVMIEAAEPATATSGGSLTNAWIRTSPVELATREPHAAWRAPMGTVGRASVVRAMTMEGPAFSEEYRGTWYIGPEFVAQPLPLVSVTVDEAELFSDAKGIYVPGDVYRQNGYGSNKWGKPYANYYGDTEIAAHLELAEPGMAATTLALDAGLAINGGGTRSLPQKALYVKMKSAYGKKNFTYNLIPVVGERTYRRFLLRPDGNDWYGPYTSGVSTMMKDAVFHRMVSGLDMATMAYRPVVVYLNGSYWGIHNLRESVDKQAFATRYGLDEDLIDVLTHEEAQSSNVAIGLVDGAETAPADYQAWLNELANANLSTEAGYQLATARMDVANYIDYIVTECFFANTDWPVNNCDFWRSSVNQTAVAGKYGDGRWRWALYDLDLAGLVVDGVGGVNRNMLTYLSANDMTSVTEPGFLINRLWQNASFKQEFIRRYTELMNTTFRPERTAAVIHAAAAEIEGEIETHFRRWGREWTQANWRQAVDRALVAYTAQRWTNSFTHASTKFALGGVGELNVLNADPIGVGGSFTVDGTVIDAGTDGVANRANWTGRYYPNRPVTVMAVPDEGYVFDGWEGSTIASASRTVSVPANGKVLLKARFRLASTPAVAPVGFAAWQLENCDEQAILRDAPEAGAGAIAVSKGGRDYTNFELFAFGLTRAEALTLTAEELRERMSIQLGADGGLCLQFRCSPYGGVESMVRVAEDLTEGWRTAMVGEDVGPAKTNGCMVTVPLVADGDRRFYRLEIDDDGH